MHKKLIKMRFQSHNAPKNINHMILEAVTRILLKQKETHAGVVEGG